jgi:hypothetical protein
LREDHLELITQPAKIFGLMNFFQKDNFSFRPTYVW